MSWYLVISCYQEHITQLLVLEVRLHFTECLLCVIRSLEKLVGGVGVHSGEIVENQPVEDKKKKMLEERHRLRTHLPLMERDI